MGDDESLKYILLVEDDTALREGLVTALQNDTISVHSAANLAEAWKILREHTFDLLLLDVNLPDGSPVTILNTHLSYESNAQQNIQFAYIADWMAKHLPANTPAVLTGDFNTEDFTAFAPVKSLGYALVNDTAHEFKTFRPYPVAIDNIVYREGDMTPEAFGMMNSDASDHNLLWCRFTLH